MQGVEWGRLAAALFYSGIFWGTMLFLINACALNRRVPFLGVGLALGVMAVSAHFFSGAVAHLPLLEALK